MKNLITAALIAATAITSTGCSSINMDKKWQGAILGAAGGTLTGGVIGHQSGNKGKGALIGGLTGAAAGGLIGNELDKTDTAEKAKTEN